MTTDLHVVNRIGWNVVIAANQFNPSVITPFWLVKAGVVAEDQFEAPTILAEGISQIRTKQFQLVATPQMLQFSCNAPMENEGAFTADVVGKIVSALPHTPYAAVGLNMIWMVLPKEETIGSLTRRLFYKEGVGPFSEFDQSDAHFGGYMSKDFSGLRAKLDIKPVIIDATAENERNQLMFSFNFQKIIKSVGEDAVEEIRGVLATWDTAKNEAEKIIARGLALETK